METYTSGMSARRRYRRDRTSLVLAAALIVVGPAASCGSGLPVAAGGARVRAGTWGGAGIELVVGATGAKVDYDCAHGAVEETMTPDRDGRFDARGTWVREHPGPVRDGEAEDVHEARYVGEISGDQMTLRVVIADRSESLGPYTLTFGR